MSNIFYYILFLLISLFILFKAIGYGMYEINTMKNKTGGLIVITFSILVTIFSNIIVWYHK